MENDGYKIIYFFGDKTMPVSMEVLFAVSLCGLACREEMDKWAFFLLPTPHPLALLQLVMLLSYEAIEVPSPQCSDT